ncbi:MAG: hypothetical protein HS115_10700 [Spirochaetales bacterium]|nr:hypothetical protein [Spirochaetales bacterium]
MRFFFFLVLALASVKGQLPEISKVVCVGQVQGCPCYAGEKDEKNYKLLLYHNEAVTHQKASTERVQIRSNERSIPACWMDKDMLRPSSFAPVLVSPLADLLSHVPLPLDQLLEDSLDGSQMVSAGWFWPTYYHLALEDFHPGPPVAVKDARGKIIARASADFLRQVTWQGSGISSEGLRIRYAGRSGVFDLYPDTIWGYGAGQGYTVLPYRTIAVHLSSFCNKLAGNWKGCSRGKVIGIMGFIPRIRKLGIRMPGGSKHDGYFCLTDTGAPAYIRPDRIDIFTGAHGGGNPYLPPERRGNALLDGGLRALVPSDWRLWRSPDDRVFCDPKDLPRDPLRPQPTECSHDYHTVAYDKRLEIQIPFRNGEPIRCKKGL